MYLRTHTGASLLVLALACLVAAPAAPAFAETPKAEAAKSKKNTEAKKSDAAAAEAAPAELPTIDVTASGVRADLDPESPTNPIRLTKSSTTHTETITRKQIEETRPTDVFDLVNKAGGVIATQSSRKGFSGLTIRGDNNFVWIVDGVYLQPTMASRIMKSIPVNIVEEVTVVRGASALTLAPMVGSASPGGAPVDGFVVVRTRKPAAREAEARVAGETNGGFQSSLWAGDTFSAGGGTGYVGAATSFATTDGPSQNLDNGVPYNAGSKGLNGLAKAGYAKDGYAFDLMAFRDHSRFEIPNANSHGSGNGSWYMDPSETLMVVGSGTFKWNDVHTTLINLSRVENQQSFWTATPPAAYTRASNINEMTHANLRHNIDVDTWRFAFGGDFRNWNAPNGQQYYEGIQREENTYGGFAQIEKRLFDDRVTIDAAVRLDRVYVLHGLDYYTGGQQPFGGVNSPLKTTNVLLPMAKFYELGGSWKVLDDVKLTARLGANSQATNGLTPAPGVTLSDDSQIKAEVGIETKINRWFNPSVNFFHRAVENEKLVYGYTYLATNGSTQTCRTGTIPTSGATSPASGAGLTPCYDQANTARQGIELTSYGELWTNGSYKASITQFTNLKNTSATTPWNLGSLSVQQKWGDYNLTGAIKYVTGYKGSTTDTGRWLGGYTSFDAGIGREFKLSHATVSTTIYGRNLTDRRYETSNGVPNVGRVLGLEVLAKF